MKLAIFWIFSIGVLFCLACSDDVKEEGTDQGTDSSSDITGDSNSDTSADSATQSSQDTASGTDTATGETSSDSVRDTTSDSVVDTSGWGTSTDSGNFGECVPVPCGGKVYGCADCIDNDSDGRVDWNDPDCLGPCDNNESGFNINIPGSDPSGCTMECYFDADNGTGNDECDWDYTCDSYNQFIKAEGDKHCPFDESPSAVEYCDGLRASQAEACNRVCEPLVPNGCDCWGCCQLDGEYRYVGTPGCTLDNLSGCDPCTPVPSCENKCGECELCIGMTTLPAHCLTPPVDTDSVNDTENPDDTADPNDTSITGDTDHPLDTGITGDSDSHEVNLLRCPKGNQPCGQVGDSSCLAGQYCLSGCCAFIVVE